MLTCKVELTDGHTPLYNAEIQYSGMLTELRAIRLWFVKVTSSCISVVQSTFQNIFNNQTVPVVKEYCSLKIPLIMLATVLQVTSRSPLISR